MQILTNLNLNKNQLQNAVIHPLATAPASGVIGQVYYNSSEKALYQHNGTAWVKVGITVTDPTAKDGKITVDGTEITVYEHPTHTAAASGLYKITVDAKGHVTATTAVTAEDIEALGIEGKDTIVADLTSNTGKVVTSASTTDETTTLGTTNVKDLTLDGITPVDGGYVANGDTIGSAISALDTAVKNAVAGGGEVNQNAFSNVKVGTTTVQADSKTDTLEIAAGGDVTVTGDATNDKVTISYTHPTTTAVGAAAVKVGKDNKGHVVIGDALKVSDLTNDIGFITNAANDLANYYLKTEIYTKDEVDGLVSAIPKFAISVVDNLPTADISTTTIYLKKTSTTETGNLYTEYIYVNNAWEELGTQKLSLTNYYTKTEVDNRLVAQATATLATTETTKTVTFTGTPISTIVRTSTGEEVITDVESKTNSVKVTLAQKFSSALTIIVTYIPTVS